MTTVPTQSSPTLVGTAIVTTWTVVVTAPALVSSESFILAGVTAPAVGATADGAATTLTSAVTTVGALVDAVATISVNQFSTATKTSANLLDGAYTSAVEVSVTGAGAVGLTASNSAVRGPVAAKAAGTSTTSVGANQTYWLYNDGRVGPAVITVKVGGTTIATKTWKFVGPAATITPTLVKSVLAIGANNAGAITAIVADANGNPVTGQAVWSVSDTAATIAATPVSCGTSSATGVVTCNLTGVAAGTANITLINASTVAAAKITSAASAVRVSNGTPTILTYVFDKATYAPGETAKITATLSNAAGVMPNGTYTVLTAGVTSNYGITLPGLTVTTTGNLGTAVTTTVIPTGISGDLTITGTAATGITATFSGAEIVNAALNAAQEAADLAQEAGDNANNAKDAADQAIEAADAATVAAEMAAEAATEAGLLAVAAAEAAGEIAQDALDAANTATDAALSAAEAADAATTAAEDAKASADAATAAVAALSAEVVKLVAELNLRITKLGNRLTAILKKVS
jgi:hypothetical protein